VALSFFADKTRPPSMDDMLAAVGARASLWQRLALFMDHTYRIAPETKFYGKSYGWMVWFRKGKKTLLALYPQQGGLTAQVVLGPALVDQALSLPLTASVMSVLEEAHPYPEGRWLFIPVTTDDEAAGVERLVLLKQMPARRARA
jgi:hypothetical protein